MNDQDKINRWVVLENAIEKAIDGGLDRVYADTVVELLPQGSEHPAFIRGVVLDPDFAKALWGESKSIKGNEPWQTLGWEHHLKNMVVAEDPIEYLAENLD